MRNCTGLLLFLAVLCGCAQDGSDVLPVFGNPQATETVRDATTVTAYRLESYPQESFSDYEMTSGPVEVSEELSTELSQLLLDHDSYVWETVVMCEPFYGVRVNFQRDHDAVDVMLCFECDIVTVYHNAQYVGGEEFDFIRDDLVKIVQQLFPDDPAIQSLE